LGCTGSDLSGLRRQPVEAQTQHVRRRRDVRDGIALRPRALWFGRLRVPADRAPIIRTTNREDAR